MSESTLKPGAYRFHIEDAAGRVFNTSLLVHAERARGEVEDAACATLAEQRNLSSLHAEQLRVIGIDALGSQEVELLGLPDETQEDADYRRHIEDVTANGRMAVIAADGTIQSVYDDRAELPLPSELESGATYERVYWSEDGWKRLASTLSPGAIEVGSFVISADQVPTVAAWSRDFASDCEWGDTDAEGIATMDDAAVIRAAARHYDGGIAQLVSDALASVASIEVRRLHSGSEDGFLWYVVAGDKRMSDGGYIEREGAEHEASDMRRLARLSEAERDAVRELRTHCVAPADFGAAVMRPDRTLDHFVFCQENRNDESAYAANRDYLLAALRASGGIESGAYLVTVEGERIDLAEAAARLKLEQEDESSRLRRQERSRLYGRTATDDAIDGENDPWGVQAIRAETDALRRTAERIRSSSRVVVDMESDAPAIVGAYLGTDEDVIRYMRPDGSTGAAPVDCVRVMWPEDARRLIEDAKSRERFRFDPDDMSAAIRLIQAARDATTDGRVRGKLSAALGRITAATHPLV